MDYKERIESIKEKNSVVHYASSVLGWPVRKSGDRCISIEPGSTNATALVVFDNFWYDHKTCQGGDVIDLCAITRHNGDKGAAIRELGGDFDYPAWREKSKALNDDIQLWHENLRTQDYEYLKARGISEDTAKRLKIGLQRKSGQERLIIPYWKNGRAVYHVGRALGEVTNDNPKYKKAFRDGYNDNIPWGLHTIGGNAALCADDPDWLEKLKQESLIIAEGAFDALSFEQEGYKVLSPMGGHFTRGAMLRQVIDICRTVKTVYLCFDSDDAGCSFSKAMSKTLISNRIKFNCCKLEEGYKDISDFYAAAGDLAALLESAISGIQDFGSRVTESATDKDEFKEFILKNARYMDRLDIEELFCSVPFSDLWLKQLRAQALSAPTDDRIVKEITAQRKLKYSGKLGFYEYVAGVWRRREDEEIKSYITKLLGWHRTGSRISSAFTVLKSDGGIVSNEEFNRQEIFNFKNCALDLKTGEQKPHSEAFMSSIQAPYEYNPGIRSMGWEKFLNEITLGDEKKKALLQEIAGYVLFSDNRLQKCFFLIGAGANGKSVFLDVLSSVFGDENISNIEMSGLVNSFQVIQLYTSILNISTETQTNVNGAESVFKQIVAGDRISACYKGKDYITFRPRAKIITACNEYIKARDTTAGFLRRICFVSFNAKFSDEPTEHGEFKADKDLTEKLKQDLPAIFNWAYEGYRKLTAARKFTVTDDEAALMDSFMKTINPIAAFIEDRAEMLETIREISRDRLYQIYTEWSKEAGHIPAARTRFIRGFNETVKQIKAAVSEGRRMDERFYIFHAVGSAGD